MIKQFFCIGPEYLGGNTAALATLPFLLGSKDTVHPETGIYAKGEVLEGGKHTSLGHMSILSSLPGLGVGKCSAGAHTFKPVGISSHLSLYSLSFRIIMIKQSLCASYFSKCYAILISLTSYNNTRRKVVLWFPLEIETKSDEETCPKSHTHNLQQNEDFSPFLLEFRGWTLNTVLRKLS